MTRMSSDQCYIGVPIDRLGDVLEYLRGRDIKDVSIQFPPDQPPPASSVLALAPTPVRARKVKAKKVKAPKVAKPAGNHADIVLKALSRAYPESVSLSDLRAIFAKRGLRADSVSVVLTTLLQRTEIERPASAMYRAIVRPVAERIEPPTPPVVEPGEPALVVKGFPDSFGGSAK